MSYVVIYVDYNKVNYILMFVLLLELLDYTTFPASKNIGQILYTKFSLD